jgi:hypothetical protein
VGGEIEGNRQALLAAGEIAAVEGVGILCSREAGILPDGPRLGDVHGRVGAAQERRDAGIAVEVIQSGEIARAVAALDRDAFRGEPGRSRRGARSRRIGKIDLRKIGNLAHRVIRSHLRIS